MNSCQAMYLQRNISILLWLLITVNCARTRETRPKYPCLRFIQLLPNSTGTGKISSELDVRLSKGAVNVKKYVQGIFSAKELCHYLQTKLSHWFTIWYGVYINSKDIETAFSNISAIKHGTKSVPSIQKLYLLATERLIKKVVQSRKSDCRLKGGTFAETKFECLVPKDVNNKQNGTYSGTLKRSAAVIYVGMFGNILSVLCLILLFIVYFKSENLQLTFPRNCILCLLAIQSLLHIFQTMALTANKGVQLCTAISILSHWTALSAFIWLSCVSYDINLKLSEKFSSAREERFIIYSSIAFGVSAVITVTCTIMHFSAGNSIGYGRLQSCFVSEIWSNFYSYLLPISITFLANIACTLYNYRKHFKKQASLVQTDPITRQKSTMAMITMLLSLEILLSRILEIFSSNSLTAHVCAIIAVSFQGVFISIGMTFSKLVIEAAKGILYRKCNQKLSYAYSYTQSAKQKRKRSNQDPSMMSPTI